MAMSRGNNISYQDSEFMNAYHKVQFFIATDLTRRKKDYQSVIMIFCPG